MSLRTSNAIGDGVRQRGRVEADAHGCDSRVRIGKGARYEYEALVQPAHRQP